jgi:hypothetical protein
MKKRDLVWKFKYDVEKRSRIARLLISIDQFFNVLIWNGSQDETISSHIGRRIAEDRAFKVERLLCSVLKKIQYNHCDRSIGE